MPLRILVQLSQQAARPVDHGQHQLGCLEQLVQAGLKTQTQDWVIDPIQPTRQRL